MYIAQFNVTLVRCLDVEEPLSLRDLQCQGRDSLDDAGALLRAALDAFNDGSLFPGCEDAQIGPVVWLGPKGAVLGTTLGIYVHID